MSEILKATCGDKTAKIECKRPSWKSVREAYAKINQEYGKGGAEAVFKKIGGKVYDMFLDEQTHRGGILNSCALRISYALNHSTILGEPFCLKRKNCQILKVMQMKYYMKINDGKGAIKISII